MTRIGRSLLLGAAVLDLVVTARAEQPSNWRVYKLADGLAESACISVNLATPQRVLAKHFGLNLLSELDGFAVKVLPAPNTTGGRVFGSPGGQLWTVTPEGLQEFRGEDWVVHPVPEIASEYGAFGARMLDPIPLYPVKQGVVLFLLGRRLMRFNCENPDHPWTEVLREASQTKLERFTSIRLGRDGGLWIAGLNGVAKLSGPLRNLKPDSDWQDYLPPEGLDLHNFFEPREDEAGGIVTLADSANGRQKVIARFDGKTWSVLANGPERIRLAWPGPDQTLWAATIDGLFQWDPVRGQMLENEEIAARQYFDVAVEPGGSFWLATSGGLYHYTPRIWRRPVPASKTSSLITCLAGDAEARLWFVSAGALHLLDKGAEQVFPFTDNIVSSPQAIRAIFPLKDGSLLLDASDQPVRFEPASGRFTQLLDAPPAGHIKPLGLLKEGSLAVQRFATAANAPAQLRAYDGTQWQPLAAPLPDSELGPELLTLFAAQNGDLWLSSERGVACYHEKKWRNFVSTDKSTPESAQFFVELRDGKIWCATTDKLWEYDGRNWSSIRSGFDRISGMVVSRDGSVWMSSNSGLHRFFQGAWVENGLEEGLPSAAVRQVYEDARGRIWAATTRGLSLFHPEADSDPPRSFIYGLADPNVREGEVVMLRFTGQDKWKHTAQDRLLYSYRLDERDWTPFSDSTTASLSDLSAGKHYFQVRAMDRNCNVDNSKPAQFEFAIIVPWFKEARLLLSVLAGAAAAVFFAGLAFNRHRQLVRSYAEVEQKVALRTKQLEVANRELLHSQKMNALGTLAAGIAHDFNNILSIIKGSAQIIEENVENPDKVRTRIDRIKTVVEQGSGIVKAMLGFTRDSAQSPDFWDINAVVEDTLKLLGDRFLREVEVQFEPASGLGQIRCPRDFIQQILLNFIFNAAESMANRKQIIISLRQATRPPDDVVLAPAAAPAYICVSVRDFGCGIAPENLSRIFEPFFTTKAFSARRGTGLGLSMAYELAKKMEAGLAVESVVDQGSTFTLVLPARHETTTPTTAHVRNLADHALTSDHPDH